MNTIWTMTSSAIYIAAKNNQILSHIRNNNVLPVNAEERELIIEETSRIAESADIFKVPVLQVGIYNCLESAIEFIDWRYVSKYLLSIPQTYNLQKNDTTWKGYTNLLTFEMIKWIDSNPSVRKNWKSFAEYSLTQSEVPAMLREWYTIHLFPYGETTMQLELVPLFKPAIDCINWREVAEEIN